MIIVQFALMAVATVAGLIVAEYLSHRLVAHYKCCERLHDYYHRHAILHHKQGRVDINVDSPAWFYLLLTSPISLVLAGTGRFVQLTTFVVLVCIYAWSWTLVHRCIHGVGGRVAVWFPFYEAIRKHHLRHHERPNRNYGALFGPALDKPLGTWSNPEEPFR